MRNTLDKLVGNWYGEQQDIIAALNEIGIDVLEANSEYIAAGYVDKETDEDVELAVRLGGTARTITIEAIEEVYRG